MALLGADDIGMDFGTATVLVTVRGKGVVLREPAVVAMDRNTRNILAVGEEAYRMQGRTPGNMMALRPMRDGTINDYDATERMLRYFLRKVIGRRMLFRPRIIACVPSGVTEVEKRSVIEAMLDAGARKAQLLDETMAAAIGAGVDIEKAYGSMVVDIGGGTADIAVISMGRVIVHENTKIGSDRFDEAIIRYLRRRHNLMIGERSAEELKTTIGAASMRAEPLYMEVTGRNLITGLPKIVRISSEEMVEALDEPLQTLIEHIQALLERTPPELAADIFDRGIILSGGGAQLYGLNRAIEATMKIACQVVDDPQACVVNGIGRVLDDMSTLGRLLFDGGRRG